MPDQVNVYRGAARAHVKGLAWSTSRLQALRFARGWGLYENMDPVLVTGVIEKSNILFAQELAPYLREGERVRIDGPMLVLEPKAAQVIAVALHELATNAAKYGALSADEGRVEVTWSCAADGQLSLRWIERGGPPVKTPTRQGFGTHIVGRMVREQSKGEMRLDWGLAGLHCEIVLPITMNSDLVFVS